jgi:SAM-dependent methyltransferase
VSDDPNARFDSRYYRRFYRGPPRAHGRREIAHLVDGVLGLCRWWGVPVRTVLDVGAGPGFWRDCLSDRRPAVTYVGIDVSDYACRTFGHHHADIATYRPRRQFDLTICQGVLQYLDDDTATAAVDNLARLTRSLLYLEVPTMNDFRYVVDAERTDLAVHRRSGAWYRERLAPHFVELGCGLHYSRRGPVPFYELEHAHYDRTLRGGGSACPT